MADRSKAEAIAEGGGAQAPDAPERSGAVILARHAEPALSRQIRLNAKGYRDWWASYEAGGISDSQNVPPPLQAMADRAGFIIASIRPRSIESARALAKGRSFAEDPLFVEAPLPPPLWPSWLSLSPRFWGFISRANWWFLNHHHGQESRREAQERADEAARQLVALASSGQDVLVVAHGFFNGMIARALKKQGWRCTLDQGYRYWSARRFQPD
ncbi:MAG: histidine phosphatase family protein [Caulobacteraceae bacterium]